MQHAKGLFNNSYPQIPHIDTYFFKIIQTLSSYLRLGLPKTLSPVGLTISMTQGTPRFNAAFTRALQ